MKKHSDLKAKPEKQADKETKRVEPQEAAIQDYTQQEVGYIQSIKNYLIILNGLPTAQINEILESETGARALVMSLKDNQVEALMLDETFIKPNEMFKRTNRQLTVSVGPHLLGRIINPLGVPVDAKGRFPEKTNSLPLNQTAGGIRTRKFITEQFVTGITKIDMLVPIAKGQRELILGPARSGKTRFVMDTIVNQRKSNMSQKSDEQKKYPPNDVIVVYGMIGKSLVDIKRLSDSLHLNHALEYTCIVATSSSDPASLIYLAPAVAMTIAEYFQRQGLDVLLILDDLGTHAKFYREISLLSNRIPGRESYPADAFSLHATIMERAGNFSAEFGGGSITALPMVETGVDDYASFIPTNLMAMTDGHLMFNPAIYRKGEQPAVDVPLSVSRVGRQTQSVLEKRLADKIKSILTESEKYETLSRFGSEISAQTQYVLNQGRQAMVLLDQPTLTKIPKIVQISLMGLIFTPFMANKSIQFIQKYKQVLINYLLSKEKDLETVISPLKNEQELFAYLTTVIPALDEACRKGGNT